MQEHGGTLWCKELDHLHDRITGKRLDNSGGKGRRGTASQRYDATDGPCRDHLASRNSSGVQQLPANARYIQQYFQNRRDGPQPSTAHTLVGGDYAVSEGGFGGGGYHGAGGNNYVPSFTPSPTAITVAHHPVADMPPVTYQQQQLPRAMIAQHQHHQHYHVDVETRMAGPGGVPYNYGTDDPHVPLGSSEQSRNAMDSMRGTRPLLYAQHQDGAAMLGAGFGPPPPHASPTLHHQNITPKRNKTAFFVTRTSGGGKPWAGGKAHYFY